MPPQVLVPDARNSSLGGGRHGARVSWGGEPTGAVAQRPSTYPGVASDRYICTSFQARDQDYINGALDRALCMSRDSPVARATCSKRPAWVRQGEARQSLGNGVNVYAVGIESGVASWFHDGLTECGLCIVVSGYLGTYVVYHTPA